MKASTLSLALLCYLLVFRSNSSLSSRINPIFLGEPTSPPPSFGDANVTAATVSSPSSSNVTAAPTLPASSYNVRVPPPTLSSNMVRVALTPPQSTQNTADSITPPSLGRGYVQHSRAVFIMLVLFYGVALIVSFAFCCGLCSLFSCILYYTYTNYN